MCLQPWGVFQTLTITYASEVCPVAMRGYLTTYVNFCWGLGQEIGIGVIMSMLKRNDEWSYRIPYGLQWMWPVPLIIGIYFAPESPWWLVRKGKLEEAKKSLQRLTSPDRNSDFDADETVAMMVHTNALEQKTSGGASYLDCFKGTDLRRTEVSEPTDVMVNWGMTDSAEDRVHGVGHPESQWQLLLQLLDVFPDAGWLELDQRLRLCPRPVRNQHGGSVRRLVFDEPWNRPPFALPLRSVRLVHHAVHSGLPGSGARRSPT